MQLGETITFLFRGSLQLVDFECWKMMFSKHEKAHFNSKASFPGHGDSAEDKHADIQGNTYAFGVILLEIISGRLPYCKDKGYLVDWVSTVDVHYLFPTTLYNLHQESLLPCARLKSKVQKLETGECRFEAHF